jgi:hypothetical protein
VEEAAAVCDRAAETRRDVESSRCHIEVRMGTIVCTNCNQYGIDSESEKGESIESSKKDKEKNERQL